MRKAACRKINAALSPIIPAIKSVLKEIAREKTRNKRKKEKAF
jgi:hypothetical protein